MRLQFFVSVLPPTPVTVSSVAAHARINPVRTAKPATVAAVGATASVPTVASASSINQVTVNPVPAQAFVLVASRLLHTIRTSAVTAHARIGLPHLHNATHASRVAAHAKTFTVDYAGPVFIGAKLGFLTVTPTRKMTRLTVTPTRQFNLTVQ